MSLDGSVQVICSVYVALLNFSDAYKQRLLQSKPSLMAFLPVEGAAEEQDGKYDLTAI